MIKIKGRSILSFILALCMVFTMLPNVVFAALDWEYEGYEDYTVPDDCEVVLMPCDGLETSNLKVTQTTMREVNAGMTFDDVYIDNPKNSTYPYAFINYYYYYNNPQNTYKTFDRSTTLSSVIWGASVSRHDESTKTITGLTLSISIDWCNDYGFFYPTTGESGDDGKWSDTNTDESRVYNTSDKTNGRMATPVRKGYEFKRWYYIENGQKVDTTYTPWYVFKQKTNYPVWEVLSYAINYELDGGTNSASNPSSYTYLDGVASFEEPTKAGYTFDGWYKDSGFKTPITSIPSESSEDITLYAKWIPNKYTLTFDANGGFILDGVDKISNQIDCGEKISDNLIESVPTKKGSTFVGWVKADGKELTDSDVMTEDGFTVYAKWEDSKYTLSYDLQGGEGSIVSSELGYGVVIKDNLTDVEPTKTGYTFKGWVKKDGTELTDSDTMGEDGFTVYAKWSVNQYTLSYDLQGGEGDIASEELNYGDIIKEKLTATIPTKKGSAFKGWVKKDGAELTDSDTMTEDGFTVYAKWEDIKYTLSYDLQGGEGDIASEELNYGDVIKDKLTKTAPTKKGHTFEGWVKADGNALTSSDVMGEDGFTVYAKWSVNQYTLIYELNDGEGDIPSEKLNYGDVIKEKLTETVPTRKGYTFKGWAKIDGTEITDSDTMGEEDFIVYAKWEISKYTLSYDLQGGEGSISSAELNYGDVIKDKLTTTIPAKKGNIFVGWVKADGSELTDSDVMDENGFTVYAKWEESKYTLSYDLQGGEGSIPSEVLSYGDLIKDKLTKAVPTKKGSTFIGWVKADGSEITDSDIMEESGFVVYAKWEVNKYTLSYDLQGGEGDIASEELSYGDVIKEKLAATVPTKKGSTFIGWVKADGSELTDSDTMGENGFTVYAKWEESKYTLSYDLQGGEGSIPSEVLGYGDVIKSKLTTTVPTKKGSTFIGWVKADGSEITDSDIMEESGFVVYAKWEVNKYTLSYDLQGGEGDIQPVELSYGDLIKSKLTTIVPTKKGSTFIGWVKADGTEITDSDTMDENGLTVYAKWEESKYTLSYDVQGGEESIPSENLSYGDVIKAKLTATVPTKRGYTFIGWVKADGTELTDSDIMGESGFVVYAKWSPNEITAGEQVIAGKYNEAVDTSVNSDILNGSGDYSFAVAEGQSLPNGIVIDQNGKVSGTCLEIGDFKVDIVVTDVNTMKTTIKTVIFNISKASYDEITFPVVNGTVEYGTKLGDIALEGNAYGEFQWVEPDKIPDVDNSGYDVKFIPNSEFLNKYDYPADFVAVKSVKVNVTAVSPKLKEAPTASSITTNTSLKYSDLTGGSVIGIDEKELDGSFEWSNDRRSFSSNGTYTETVIFTPKSSNYKAIEFDVNVRVTQSKKSSSSGGKSSVKRGNYTVKASTSKGGTITNKGENEFSKNKDVTYIIEPDEGYEIAEILVDGKNVEIKENENEYTFENLKDDHDIYVRFEKIGESDKTDKADNSYINPINKVEVANRVKEVFNTDNSVSYISGYPDNSFRPSSNLTRGEGSAIIAKLLLQQPENEAYDTTFTDVDASQWYNSSVAYLAARKIINGYPDGSFKPNVSITRGEMVTIIVNSLGLSGTFESNFTDTEGSWAEGSIAIASELGWISGYPDGSFRPNENITRAEAVALINRVVGREKANNANASFNDVDNGQWYYGDVMASVGNR